jgi:hypothetical protein
MQLFATRGYAVLFPDEPLRHGNPLADWGKTVLPAINKVIEMGIADPERQRVPSRLSMDPTPPQIVPE